jgi:hypothetical protein
MFLSRFWLKRWRRTERAVGNNLLSDDNHSNRLQILYKYKNMRELAVDEADVDGGPNILAVFELDLRGDRFSAAARRDFRQGQTETL